MHPFSLSYHVPSLIVYNSHPYLPLYYPAVEPFSLSPPMSLPRWGGIIAGEAVGLGGLRAVMMLLASIKSLQAAESISPVVKLHLTQGVAFLQAAVSELCMCVCFLCVCV